MRKLKIMGHVSLDGVIAPDEDTDFGRGGWQTPYRSRAGAEAVVEAQGARFDLLLGRRTYDLWSGFWPTQQGGLFADAINAATKYVATHRPESLAWGPVEALGADLIAGVRRLKVTDGADLVTWGSTTLTSALLDEGLVDEVVMIVYPVVLGRGKRLFSDHAKPRELALIGTQASPTGVLVATYRHVGAVH
jgi:dihydrofolate reductase